MMTGIFSQVQTKLGKTIRLVSISIDPEYDTPDRLKAYAKRFDAGAQWAMLTGSAQDSIAVQRAFAAYRGDKMEHTATTFMRAQPGQPWVRIDGLASADDLVREIQHLASR
jgi:protein SCO1/2